MSKYYIDKQWQDRWGSYSYEIPPQEFYNNYQDALKECNYKNKHEDMLDNEFYEVVEIEGA